jgi:hypothetical protein
MRERKNLVVEVSADLWMVGSQGLFIDSQRPAKERLGSLEPVGIVEQPRQVVEADGDAGMVRAKVLLVYF